MDSFVDAPDDRSPEHPGGDGTNRAPTPDERDDAGVQEDVAEIEASFDAERSARRRHKIFFCVTISFICAALIALIWVATNQAIQDQRAETMARAKAWVEAQANLLTESARRELATVDQSLIMLEAAFRADPQHFDLRQWQAKMPGLSDVVNEYFIANSHDLILQDTLPQAVGQGIGGAYASFGRGALEQIKLDDHASPGTSLLVGEVNQSGVARQYLMYLVRPVPIQPGFLVGASYRSSALVKVFGEGGLGARGLAALIDTRRGGVQAVAGPAALHPKLNVTDTAMFKAFRDDGFSGEWTGPTGMDGVQRIHAFHRVPGRDLVAIVGLDLLDWMAPTESWAEHARELAGLASLLVLAIGGLVLWWLWTLETNRQLRHALEAQAALAGGAGPDDAAPSSLAPASDRLALLGPDGRGVAWTAASSGVAAEAAQRGVPVDEVLREHLPPVPSRIVAEPGSAPEFGQPAVDDVAGYPAGVPVDPTIVPVRADHPTHLIERVAERLLRSGALESSAANLLHGGSAHSRVPPEPAGAGGARPNLHGGDMPGLPPGLGAHASIHVPSALHGTPAIDLIALERAGMVDWSRTRSRVSEEFRLVQRQLITTAFTGPNAQPGFSNLVMVTSARPGEGKSFMALNLAGSIARQGDNSVLLIDADSKRDSFCYPLGLAEAPGLLDLAANPRLDAGQCIVKTPIERLSILPIGRERERGPELFSSKEMARLIQTLGRRYSDRLVILDAPPCLSTSDPAVLASAVGQILLVVEAERTQRDEVEAAIELVEECPNLTLVLNKQRAGSRFNFGTYASYYSS